MDDQKAVFKAEFYGFAQTFMREFSTEESDDQFGENANRFTQLMKESLNIVRDSDNKTIKDLIKKLDFQSLSDENAERVIPTSMVGILTRFGNPKSSMSWGRIVMYYKFVELIMNGPFQIMGNNSKCVLYQTSIECLEKILVENHDWIKANGGWERVNQIDRRTTEKKC